jgi:ornithine carbamoyltransferase
MAGKRSYESVASPLLGAEVAIVTDFLALDDHRADTLEPILTRAIGYAQAWRERQVPHALEGVRVALIVDDGGWRNTTAFELGVKAMGGLCVRAPISLAGKEAVGDVAQFLDNWFDIVVIRTPDLGQLRRLAEAATLPVINARTRSNHPCETLGDLAYVLQQRGDLSGLRVAVVAPDDNILGSWAEAAAVLPIEVVQIYPERWHARRFAMIERFSATTEMGALASADVVITDSWPKDVEPAEVLDYQIAAATLEHFAPDGLFIPCPPVTRGQEVTADAMVSPSCHVIAAKAFLLHAQNALLEAVAHAIQ